MSTQLFLYGVCFFACHQELSDFLSARTRVGPVELFSGVGQIICLMATNAFRVFFRTLFSELSRPLKLKGQHACLAICVTVTLVLLLRFTTVSVTHLLLQC